MPDSVQWVKDLTLLQLWHRLQLWLSFIPWLGNFHTTWVWPTKKVNSECVEWILKEYVAKNQRDYQLVTELMGSMRKSGSFKKKRKLGGIKDENKNVLRKM